MQLKKSYSVLFVFERFALQIIPIKKNLIQYFFVIEWFALQIIAIKKILFSTFLYLNGLHREIIAIKKIIFNTFLYLNGCTANHCNQKNLIQYFFVFERFALQIIAIKKSYSVLFCI